MIIQDKEWRKNNCPKFRRELFVVGALAPIRRVSYFSGIPKAIVAHGFAKRGKSNITKNELEGFKIMANAFLNLNDEQIKILIDKQNLTEVL